MPRRLLLLSLSAITAVAFIACGGGHKGSSTSSGGSASPPGAVLDKIDLAQSVKSLETLKSFRFDLSLKLDLGSTGSGSSSSSDDGSAFAAALLGALGDIKASGTIVAPDQADVRMTLFGQEFGYVQIGKQAWQKTGKNWEATEPGESDISLKPDDLFGQFLPDQVLKVAKTSTEKVNGVTTTRYSFDKNALQQILGDLGEQADLKDVSQASLDIWMNGDNVPVKLSMNVAAKSTDGQNMSLKVEMNIRDINDPSIKIKPPV